ncbi:MAG: glycoside hydrolase family 10 protein [Bacteroidota bacterium]
MKLRVRLIQLLLIIITIPSCTSIKNFTSKYSPFTTRREVVMKGEGKREEVEDPDRSVRRGGNAVDSLQLTVNSQPSTVNTHPTTNNLQPTTTSTVNSQQSTVNSQLTTNNLQPTTSSTVNPQNLQLPQIPREFRAAWIASVANINWPSKPGLTTAEQKQEALQLLDYLKTNNFNAVILQVRPQADALYKSNYEPWSYFLTGKQNQAPQPFYDPLQFWIDEAHERGMELHAWLNPYRAHHTSSKDISNESIVRKNPEMVYRLKEGFYWMDPSKKETQDLTTKVVMDIVNRYDVDGIHFDDYFYPYPSYNGDSDFPDEKSYQQYINSNGMLSKGDWRRASVNNLIERVYKEIKTSKSHVKFGISPFGIWRPGFPASIKGFDQYEKLYADAKLWLNKGWIDYFTPQLYWPTSKTEQSFPVLLSWWQEENTFQRHLWPGININTDKYGRSDNAEIEQEIEFGRKLIPKSNGVVHWNISMLTKNPSLTKTLNEGPYKTTALVPASKWLDSIPPANPTTTVKKIGAAVELNWNPKENDVFQYILYTNFENNWEYQILPKSTTRKSLNKFKIVDGKKIELKKVIVSAIDRAGNESNQEVIEIE